ncbi:Concanavalin A-like lectin/glucanase subgroup [Penicillium maclennaniae]|uniref:Concanavalin A-like lectin/glucanase subgroup n=1 Tax=Penicillium maclennaniae TaxID=1343394 RepID=UPI0025405109|nr:Concanavalin A-like lectin/glucanase subgroup [Penicillium maclennaniae]KAJ5669930.1 Concanavalin A-like lectin/glucanase subgroup [Penicillium maclennaniae]
MVYSMFSQSAGSLFLLALASSAAATLDYNLVEKWEGTDFLDYFNFHVGSDPTNGYVNYLSEADAKEAGLVKVTDSGSLYLGVDHTNKVASTASGRDSVRIGSKKYYDHSLIVADIEHMPGSVCGTWPAFWSVGKNWPSDGEIDIIEGVNLQDHNEIVMHTAGTCSITDQGMSGAVNATGCGEDLGTVGCVIEGQTGSYGTSFNKQSGGVYAMEWTEKYLKIWFFARGSIPASITNGNPDVSEFGTPMALVEEGCDVATSFKAQSFIFDTTFCGDWAGGVFGESGCPMTSSNPFTSCHNYVAENPSAFEQSYWEINSVKIYQTGVKGIENTSKSTASATKASAIVETTETSVTQKTATHVIAESSARLSAGSSAGEETSAAGAVAPLGGSITTASAASHSTTSETPAAAITTETHGTTRYITKYVTTFTTLCDGTSSALPAVTESAHSQVPAAAQTSQVVDTSSAAVQAQTTPVSTGGAEAKATQAPTTDPFSDTASKIATEASSPQALPTVIPGPGYDASILASADSAQTSKPIIPAPTGSSVPSGTVFSGSSSTGYSPVFTGAADKVSVKFTTFAAAFAFAFFA